ncbi:hypothetical protein [Corynebacterium cystitidis]|uniref:hypothetical protein n=1 Tax=Corynebacterium cystitidis TaxID=35757 RepID=UPI00211E53BE|nr:hypothetical protein [Corynebacterium cystitidis]
MFKLRKLSVVALSGVLVLHHPFVAEAQEVGGGPVTYVLPDGYLTSSHPSSPVGATYAAFNGMLGQINATANAIRNIPQAINSFVVQANHGSSQAVAAANQAASNATNAVQSSIDNALNTAQNLSR